MILSSFTFKVSPDEAFKKLETGLQRKALRIALNAGAAPVKAAVIASAPKDAGHLAKATVIKVKNYKRGSTWVAIIGAGSKYKRLKKVKGRTVKKRKKNGQTVRAVVRPYKYQSFVDKGTSKMSGRHYLEAAFETSQAAFEQRAMAKLAEVIQQLLKQN